MIGRVVLGVLGSFAVALLPICLVASLVATVRFHGRWRIFAALPLFALACVAGLTRAWSAAHPPDFLLELAMYLVPTVPYMIVLLLLHARHSQTR